MELRSLSRPSEDKRLTRRAWFLAPAMGAGSVIAWWLSSKRALPNAAENGTGEFVTIVLFSDGGKRLEMVRVRTIVKSLDEWRRRLDSKAFAVTRKQATEFAFQNLYWNNHMAGIYRCVCCGNAVFRSEDKFDSETGWPSFKAPIAAENVASRLDRSLGLERSQVLCRKCDAHLGHLFDDGPEPSFRRYCLNSAALRFVQFG